MTETALIPVGKAMLWWNRNDKVLVDYQMVRGRYNTRPDRLLGGNAEMTSGCCNMGWPDTPPWTPICQFLSLVLNDGIDVKQALEQFAKIGDCDWARYGLANFDYRWCTPGERKKLSKGLVGLVEIDDELLNDPEMLTANP